MKHKTTILADEIARLYKEKHGEQFYHAALWGASQVFLSEESLEKMLEFAQWRSQENN